MTICNFNGVADNGQPIKAECPEAKDEFGFDGYYPWLDDICGGVEPCADCVPTPWLILKARNQILILNSYLILLYNF